MPKCSQCDRLAFYDFAGHPLCVEHGDIVQRNNQRRIETAMWGMVEAEINIAESVGDVGMLSRAFAKMEALSRMKQTTVQQHNVNVSNSVIGAVTTGGSIQTLNVRIGDLQQRPETAEVAKALHELKEAVVQSKAITPQAQGEMVGQLTYLADQAAKPPEQREAAAIKPVLVVLRSSLSLVADLVAVWDKWGPLLTGYLLGSVTG